MPTLLLDSAEGIALEHGDGTSADLQYFQAREMLRDAIIYLELREAASYGDPGRVIVASKLTVPRFAATGHHRYSSEMLEIIYELRYELPAALATTMLAASLVNHAGRPDSWLPADLDIEHLVNELKNVYKITSSNASDFVTKGEMGQIMNVLRQQRLRWYRALGINSRSNKHKSRSIQQSVLLMSTDFAKADIFAWRSGRSCKAFELHRGDDVQRRKTADERTARQSKGVATDNHVYGHARLAGAGGKPGLFGDWLQRRLRDVNHQSVATSSSDEDIIEADDFGSSTFNAEELVSGFSVLSDDSMFE